VDHVLQVLVDCQFARGNLGSSLQQRHTVRVLIPRAAAGSIIGKDGASINQIKQK